MPTTDNCIIFWGDVLESIRGQVTDSQYATWFANTRCRRIDEATVTIEVPNAFCQTWLQREYMTVLRQCLDGVDDQRREIVFEVAPKEARDDVDADTVVVESDQPLEQVVSVETGPVPPVPPAAVGRPVPSRTLNLNSDYTFDNFVVGPSNRLSHAASMAIVEQTGHAYNPMFLHGGLGLGKTHLMQAVCHALLARRPDLRLRYVPCEQFINEFIAALEKGQVEKFRNRCRQIDVLLIDDIHFLAHKDHSQEEFFHTFNALYNEHKQIILSSDCPPKEIPTLEERLVSRFKWGLVCEIEQPTFETRMTIIRKKAARQGTTLLPDAVVELLAAGLQTNIREIEGAVTSLLSRAAILGEQITVDLAQATIAGLAGPRKRRVTIDRIIAAVTAHYGVRLSDLQSKKRAHSITLPRQVCMFLARSYTNHSLAEIGGYFGGRDHSTVLYATDKIGKLLDIDAELRLAVREMRSELDG